MGTVCLSFSVPGASPASNSPVSSPGTPAELSHCLSAFRAPPAGSASQACEREYHSAAMAYDRTSRPARWPGRLKVCAPPRPAVGLGTRGRTATKTWSREEGHGDYINANFIRGTDGSQAYIATQGPLPHTLLDFWRLVWEFGVKVILMACQETENGRKKCERYWAQEQEPLQTGPFHVTLMKETPVNADIILRTLQVTFQKESRSVHQLQYMSWPDHGVPSHPDHILAMVEEARRLQGVGPGPLCVHCSAGCGRTGVLCAVDYVRQLLLTQSHPISASSKWSLRCGNSGLLRCRQSDCASQQEQYRFLYHTVAQLFSSTLQNASPHYQNLKENCAPICKDALSLRTSPTLPAAVSRPPGGVLRSISVPGPPTLPMADTYAVVQKRGAPAGTGPGTRAPSSADTPIYSQVAARAPRPIAQTEDGQGTSPLRCDQNPPGPDAYEEVTNGAQTGGLGAPAGVLRRITLSHHSLCMAPFCPQASTCALEGLKGHGNRQRSGRGCECLAPDAACRSVMAGLLQPPCCCALCYV
nr:tyrosine-protein phosphatase non-receptor type 18 isoform X4 [Meriones unguiculatus]XP_021518602.1 tyrosine-protein phosphatase non-receptor type 18-like isoform X4 [Meriones unguiculatus]